MRVLIILASLSGNTRELARQIAALCQQSGHQVDMVETDDQSAYAMIANLKKKGLHDYSLYLFGTWTDNAGLTPSDMKRWIIEFVSTLGKPAHAAVFGTGETQWGQEFYCGAVHRLAQFFQTTLPRLCIEQMPHGAHDSEKIAQWTTQVLEQVQSELEKENEHSMSK